MRNQVVITSVAVSLIALFFLGSAARADSCNDILWRGIYDELKYERAEEFQKNFSLVLKMSREEREKYLKEREGSLTVGLKKILTIGLSGGDTEEDFKELKESVAVDEKLMWNSKSFQKIQLILLWPFFSLTYPQRGQAVECFPAVEARRLNPA